MTHTYHIAGMTCKSCVAKVKNELLKMGDITEASVQLESPQATISMQKHIAVDTLQSAIQKAGNYTITAADGGMNSSVSQETQSWLKTYKPVLLLFFYISIISVVVASTGNAFDLETAMRVFMSGFFLSFSFFKLLNLSGFVDSYSMYDIIAKRFRGWGYIYAFIELGLGIAFALNLFPIIINIVTLVVMSVSLIGVVQAVTNKRKIQCACLGAVFNLPMSTVTVIEDLLMILMSGIMLVTYLS